MYWLLSIVIIIVMIAALAVAGSTVLPDTLLFIDLASFSVLPYLLSISIILAFLMQRRVVQRQSFFNFSSISSQYSALKPRSFFNFSVHALYYLIITLLASTLVVFSGLQALKSHQSAERAKITQSMRVQALVTIEGISDSVYDPTIDSGYRQVAIISHLSPLIAEISAKNLSSKNIEQALTDSESYSNNAIENSLSSNIKLSQYQVLLSAYPNKSTKDTNFSSR